VAQLYSRCISTRFFVYVSGAWQSFLTRFPIQSIVGVAGDSINVKGLCFISEEYAMTRILSERNSYLSHCPLFLNLELGC